MKQTKILNTQEALTMDSITQRTETIKCVIIYTKGPAKMIPD